MSTTEACYRNAPRARVVAGLSLAAMLAGCAIGSVEIQNREPAQELQRESRPPGSAPLGRAVYEDRCARCHGGSATGTALAPDLLPIVHTMGLHRFVASVLRRYDGGPVLAGLEREPAPADEGARGAPPAMPDWRGDARLNAHLVDLFAYLSARAEGLLGPQR